MIDVSQLIETLDSHPEWLLICKGSRPFPLKREELSVDVSNEKVLLDLIDDQGFRSCRIASFSVVDDELTIAKIGRAHV